MRFHTTGHGLPEETMVRLGTFFRQPAGPNFHTHKGDVITSRLIKRKEKRDIFLDWPLSRPADSFMLLPAID